MSCEKIKDQFADYLTGDIDPAAKTMVQNHIAVCSGCREEIESLSVLWNRLGVLPREQPSERLRSGFYAMLGNYKKGLDTENRRPLVDRIRSGWREFWSFRKPAYAVSFSLVLMTFGLGAGFLLSSGFGGAKRNEALNRELRDMRQTVALSLIDRPSATDRLEGIGWSSKVENPDEKTLLALIKTLDDDPNINVRLAAVDALYLFRNNSLVKTSLVRSLQRQNSPLVQIALIDLLTEIRERRAADALKTLIQEKRLNPEVKEHATLGLKQII